MTPPELAVVLCHFPEEWRFAVRATGAHSALSMAGSRRIFIIAFSGFRPLAGCRRRYCQAMPTRLLDEFAIFDQPTQTSDEMSKAARGALVLAPSFSERARYSLLMTMRGFALAVSALGVICGFGGYLVIARMPLLMAIGFVSLMALIVLLANRPDRHWQQAGDLRRADQHEEHRMSDGPAPPFQS